MAKMLLDAETVREMMYLKAVDLGIEPEIVEQLDVSLCGVLGIDDPEPIIDQP